MAPGGWWMSSLPLCVLSGSLGNGRVFPLSHRTLSPTRDRSSFFHFGLTSSFFPDGLALSPLHPSLASYSVFFFFSGSGFSFPPDMSSPSLGTPLWVRLVCSPSSFLFVFFPIPVPAAPADPRRSNFLPAYPPGLPFP